MAAPMRSPTVRATDRCALASRHDAKTTRMRRAFLATIFLIGCSSSGSSESSDATSDSKCPSEIVAGSACSSGKDCDAAIRHVCENGKPGLCSGVCSCSSAGRWECHINSFCPCDCGGCPDTGTTDADAGEACPDGAPPSYVEPGCGDAVKRGCFDPLDACLGSIDVCTCSGKTISAPCGYAPEPYRSSGSCADASDAD